MDIRARHRKVVEVLVDIQFVILLIYILFA